MKLKSGINLKITKYFKIENWSSFYFSSSLQFLDLNICISCTFLYCILQVTRNVGGYIISYDEILLFYIRTNPENLYNLSVRINYVGFIAFVRLRIFIITRYDERLRSEAFHFFVKYVHCSFCPAWFSLHPNLRQSVLFFTSAGLQLHIFVRDSQTFQYRNLLISWLYNLYNNYTKKFLIMLCYFFILSTSAHLYFPTLRNYGSTKYNGTATLNNK